MTRLALILGLLFTAAAAQVDESPGCSCGVPSKQNLLPDHDTPER